VITDVCMYSSAEEDFLEVPDELKIEDDDIEVGIFKQGDRLSGKPGNVREFGTYQGNVRDVVNSQGNVSKKILSWKS